MTKTDRRRPRRRRALAVTLGVIAAALAACDTDQVSDEPPSDIAPPTDGYPVDALRDAEPPGPDATLDARVDAHPADMAADMAEPRHDADPDADPDIGPPCPQPIDEIELDEPPADDGGWHLVLDMPATHRWSPMCGDSRGGEQTVGFTAHTAGTHLLLAEGDLGALYASKPCGVDEQPLACAVGAADPLLLRLDLTPGDRVVFAADAPADREAGPVRLALYPPRQRDESCALLDLAPIAPPCAPGLACVDDVCAAAEPPRLDEAWAWTDGQSLRVAVDEADADLVPLLWARADAADAFDQLELMSARAEGDRVTLTGFIEAPHLASAAEVEVEIIDDIRREARLTIPVGDAVPREVEDACDTDGLEDACVRGTACLLGACRPVQTKAWRGPAGAHLAAKVFDVPAELDDVTVRYRHLDIDGEPLGGWTHLPRLAVEDEFGLEYGAVVPAPAAAVAVALRVAEVARPPSLPVATELAALPLRPPGTRCDPTGLTDLCTDDLACIAGNAGAHCQQPAPPTITGLRAYLGEQAIGLEVAYDDPNDDVVEYGLELRDRNGARIALFPPAPFPARAAPGEPARFSMAVGRMPRPGAVARLVLIDSTDLVSEPAIAPFEDAPVRALDEPCDPLGGLDLCPDDALCAPALGAQDATCRLAEVECPEPIEPVDYGDRAAPFNWQDSNRGGADNTGGACGGAGHPETVLRFRAARSERVRITVQPPDATLYLRRYCALAVPVQSELACDDDGAVDVELAADDVHFLFVDGPAPGGRFEVMVEPLAP